MTVGLGKPLLQIALIVLIDVSFVKIKFVFNFYHNPARAKFKAFFSAEDEFDSRRANLFARAVIFFIAF